MTYAEKLKDPRWQRRRLEVLSRDGFTCRDCGDSKKTLHVHHCHYCKGAPWETPLELLLTLCGECHEERQQLEDEAKQIVGTMLATLANHRGDYADLDGSSQLRRFTGTLRAALPKVIDGESEIYVHADLCDAFDQGRGIVNRGSSGVKAIPAHA
jgi:hypothetical protein